MTLIWKPQSIDIYKSWINTIENEASDNLNDWETHFISNMQTLLINNFNLTQGQAIKLEQIYTKHTK